MEQFRKRFEAHMERHPDLTFAQVEAYLNAHPDAYRAYQQMEETAGEPDVIYDAQENRYLLMDCSTQTPKRLSICYDKEARLGRKKFPPQTSAMELAEQMGVQLVDLRLYELLQQFGPVDTKTSSWLATPEDIRALGGALFGDYHYGHVFYYHNGADSYYSSRGFRGYIVLHLR